MIFKKGNFDMCMNKLKNEVGFVPKLFEDLYLVCNTSSDEVLVGLQMMNIKTICEYYRKYYKVLSEYGIIIIPFMNGESGQLVYVKIRDDENVVYYHNGGYTVVNQTVDSFWNMVLSFYKEGVYYIEDGVKSIDYEKLSEVYKRYS